VNPGNEPLVSVVVPAYNEERHIAECIESVLAQTHPNWHLAIVDNASTDRTYEIVQGYVARDSRISVLRNATNVPVIDNYNAAFRQLSPQARYCKVVAADDWIYPECLAQMVALAEANPGVAIVGAYSRARGGVDPYHFPFPHDVVPGHDVMRSYLSRGPHLVGAPSSLMYRADVVRDSPEFFREQSMHADAEACLRVLEHHDYGFVQQVLTYTRMREGSLTSFADRVNVYIPNILEFLIRFGPTCFDERQLKLRIRDQLAHYYNYLGRQAWRGREQEFWTYHRDRMAALGHPMSRVRIGVDAILYQVEEFVRRLRRRF
jgi:glycosyltransferase involved in cell wall biosynthesis